MFGQGRPQFNPGAGMPGGYGITGSPATGWTATRTASASAEAILTLGVSDANGAYIGFGNSISPDLSFSGYMLGSSTTNRVGLTIYGQSPTDSGTNPLMEFIARIGGSTAATVRPLFSWRNGTTQVLTGLPLNAGAQMCLNFGASAGDVPFFSGSGRSIGTRAVWRDTLAAAAVDFATGVSAAAQLWHSIPQASVTYEHAWWAGQTKIATLFGDGTYWLGAAPTNVGASFHGVQGTSTSTATSTAAAAAQLISNPTADTAALYTGAHFQGGSANANVRNFTATVGLVGVVGQAAHRGTGTVTGAAAFTASTMQNSGGGTVTNQYGFHCPTLSGAGSANYAFYAASNPSYFGGGATLGGVSGTVTWISGAGSPEGSRTAAVGSLYTRTDGGAGTTLYVKESGTGNTGWVAK